MEKSWSRTVAAFLAVLTLVGCRIDHGLDPYGFEGIEGAVSFAGEWPEDLEEVRVAVYPDYPPADFFALAGYSDPVPLKAAAFSYRVRLLPGVYAWVVVVGRRRDQDWIQGNVLLGQFTSTPGDAAAAAVTVREDRTTCHVDMTVDFADLPDPPPLPKALGAGGCSRRE